MQEKMKILILNVLLQKFLDNCVEECGEKEKSDDYSVSFYHTENFLILSINCAYAIDHVVD